MTFDEFKSLILVHENERGRQSSTNETFNAEVRSSPNRESCLRMIYDQCVRYWGTDKIVIFDVSITPGDYQVAGFGVTSYEGIATSQLDFGQYVLITRGPEK